MYMWGVSVKEYLQGEFLWSHFINDKVQEKYRQLRLQRKEKDFDTAKVGKFHEPVEFKCLSKTEYQEGIKVLQSFARRRMMNVHVGSSTFRGHGIGQLEQTL